MAGRHVALTTVALMALGGLLVMAGGAAGSTASPLASAIRSDRPVEAPAPVVTPTPEAPTPAEKPAAPEPATPDERPSVSAVEPVGARERDEDDERREIVRPSIRDEDDDDEDDDDDESSDETSTPGPEDADSDEQPSS